MKHDYAARALALVGTRFRPQGRGPEGLDCVGLAMAAFGLPSEQYRRNYRLGGDHDAEVAAALKNGFRKIAARQMRAGDLIIARVASDQLHLCIKTNAGFVHADARLRQVVETPGTPPWPIVALYRKRRD